MAIKAPRYTQTPNDIFDLIPEMGEAELKVTLIVIRQTLGWHKETDKISLTQLMKRTGMGRKAVVSGIRQAADRGVLKVRKTPGGMNRYSLNIEEEQGEVVSEGNQQTDEGSIRKTPGVVSEGNPQKKVKDTILNKKDSDSDESLTCSGTDERDLLYRKAMNLAKLCEMDYELMKGRLFKNAKKLGDRLGSVEEFRSFKTWWYQNDWRGKKGQPPKPDELLEVYGQFAGTVPDLDPGQPWDREQAIAEVMASIE